MRLRSVILPIAILLLVPCLYNNLSAQTTSSGALTGVVTDPSNAVVPDAVVEIRDTAKGTAQSTTTDREGVRLYFEVQDLDEFYRKLQQKGFHITQLPRMMPWGWRHAYLNDPDGHEMSLYWAGENRMKKTVMKAARKAAAT